MCQMYVFGGGNSFYWDRACQAGTFGSHAEGGEDMSGMHRHRMKHKRSMIQLLSAVLLNGYMIGFRNGKIYTGKAKAVCVPVLNCYSCPGALGACPVGALQAAVGGGKGHVPFYVLGILMLFGVVLGRVVCGFLCPFGFVQDLLYKIPVPKLHVPKKIDRPARYLKYVVLLAAVILLPVSAAAKTGAAVPYFCKYICPAGTLGGALPLMGADPVLRDLTGTLFDWKLFVLAVVMILSMLISRPFCRYLCPLGAFYALFNRFSFFQMQLDQTKCTGCGACERVCPMEVEVTRNINSAECIRCGKCKGACPTGAISSGFGNKEGTSEPGNEASGKKERRIPE